jgi:hypothetical protein
MYLQILVKFGKKLQNLYSSPNIVSVLNQEQDMKRAWREMINVYNILIGKSEGRRQLGET